MLGCLSLLKLIISKACHKYIHVAECPGRVVTTDVIASLIGAAWLHSFIPINTLSGFRKCGIFPFNPRSVTDRQLGPSKAFQCTDKANSSVCEFSPHDALFPQEEQLLCQKCYEEG